MGSSFQVTQQQVLHGIKTDGAQPEGVLHGVVDFLVEFLVGEIFQKSQHLHEFPLAPPSHPPKGTASVLSKLSAA